MSETETDFLKELENGETPEGNESQVGNQERGDGAHTEALKGDGSEAHKSEPHKTSNPGVVPTVVVEPTADAPKPDAPKPDAPKPDAPKADAPKPDAIENAMMKAEKLIMDSRKLLKEPCPSGQMYFEAPDGFVAAGDAKRPHLWYRKLKCWMNPIRSSRKS